MEVTMSELVLKHGLWLAVCDGQKALLLENSGDHAFPRLETREAYKQENPPSHDQGSAPPGRVFASGERRAATEENDFHQQKAEQFLSEVAEHINQFVAAGRIRSLALVAPARALGVLRSRISEQTRKILVAELAHDYVKMPVHEIERSLQAAQ
jgi:protein required for attachment to host cells